MAVRADDIPVPRGRPRLAGRVREWLDQESILGPVLVTPALLLLVLLVAHPFLMALYSVVNWTGIAVGFMDPPGPNWLGQKYYAMTAVVTVNVWRGLPFFAITILAGLVAIPRELYEAAEADGAGPVARFWLITLPLLKPVLAIVVLFSTIFTFSDFNIVYVLTRGGPINSTHLFATLSRVVGIDTGRIGEGAAISLYLFPLLVFVVWAQLRFVRKQVY